MIQPPELLQHFGVSRVVPDDTFIGITCADMLIAQGQLQCSEASGIQPYIALLLKHVSNLEPDVGVSKRIGRVPEDAIKTV